MEKVFRCIRCGWLDYDERVAAYWPEFAQHGKEGLEYAELTQLPELRESIQRYVDEANAKLERWETVKKFAILSQEFSVDDGGVTPNMKIRRAAVTQRFADVVAGLYEDEIGE